MKKIILLLIIFITSCATKQVLDKSIISQNQIKQKGFQLVLKNVYNDSRCPENVTCVWAGEVYAQINVFENDSLVEEKTLVFNSRNANENKDWVAKFYKEKPIKLVQVLPYPKDGISNELKDYYLKIEY